MDLGKMLLDALCRASSASPAEGNLKLPPGYFDLHAAAEAFLAKVREAEKTEVDDHTGPVPSYGDVEQDGYDNREI